MRRALTKLAFLLVVPGLAAPASARTLTPAQATSVDRAAAEILTATGAPSASLAIVQDGRIVYEGAYGLARRDPDEAATPDMRYAIGSLSKQFTAAALLLLAEDGALSLDEPIVRWVPELPRAREITLRQLLSMTAGYRDYWPHDYVFPDILTPTTSEALFARWASGVDFEPGTRWQYSNTNYQVAAVIAERAAGEPLMAYMRRRIFGPLGMRSVVDVDHAALGARDAAPFLRHALGPLRPAPKEGRGWLQGAAHLAMTARDLALWNISVINRTLLKPQSYAELQRATLLSTGNAAGYGLGVEVSPAAGRRALAHSGAISGYTSHNRIFPDDRAAIVVFTNIYPGSANAPRALADRIADLLFEEDAARSAAALANARAIYDGLRLGQVDRRLLTPSASAYFTPETLADFRSSLAPLAPPSEFAEVDHHVRGGFDIRTYRIRVGGVEMELVTLTTPDNRYEQYVLSRAR